VGAAIDVAKAVAAGHFFVAFIRNAFPINVLPAVKMCPEVCSIFCATANPVAFLVMGEEDGRGVIGVIDGLSPVGVEKDEHQKTRKEFLRKIGYKISG
jgi:adenosine/AMP kinase